MSLAVKCVERYWINCSIRPVCCPNSLSRTHTRAHSALKPEVRGKFCIKFQIFQNLVSLDKK